MRIKMLVSCSGTNFAYTAGQEYDVDENTGRDLVKCGYAKNVKVKKLPQIRRSAMKPDINIVKEYLRLDSNSEDEYLNVLILLAEEICENFTRRELPEELPKSYEQAMLIIIGYFFEHRDGTKEGLPKVIYALLQPYRKAAF